MSVGEIRHRGVLQAQGGRLQESESWARVDALPAVEGLELLERLRNKLTPADARARSGPFQDARRYIEGAQRQGGASVPPPISKSFYSDRPVRNTTPRVDVVVKLGTAFV